MDENSFSSDSVCSDDTEYLLGQNVSIRDIDDFDMKPIVVEHSRKTASLRSNAKSHPTRLQQQTNKLHNPPESIEMLRIKDDKTKDHLHQKRKEQEMSVYQEKEQHSIRYSTPLYRAHSGSSIKYKSSDRAGEPIADHKAPQRRENMNDVRMQPCRKTQTEFKHLTRTNVYHEDVSSAETSVMGQNKRQAKKELKSNVKEKKSHKDAHLTMQNTRQRKTEPMSEQKQAWRQTISPSNHDNSWDMISKNQHDKFDSLEHADLGSITSEATEELLKGDELDSSIVEKLKELNLAVNFDSESQDISDDKVREGAQLLSKLFGGSVDNYYSSPPSAHSGSVSGQESSRGESGIEEKRNASNTSSKASMASFARTSLQFTPEEQKKLQRKPKVSFATDESTSFDCSPSVRRSPNVRRSKHDDQGNTQLKKESWASDKSEGYSGFVKETSALRAAMDYGDGDDDDDDKYRHERSPVRSIDNYKEAKPSLSDYARHHQDVAQNDKDQHQQNISNEDASKRYRIERYSDSPAKKLGRVMASSVDGEPQWDGFYTSTPHKTDEALPGNPQADKDQIEMKLYLEKKLQETENKLDKRTIELGEIKSEVEGFLTTKKVALEEVQVLGDKLKRTKADIKTSETLSEQYKQRVTTTRSELMELEVEREAARQDIKDMENLLIKQKQEVTEVIKVERKNERKVLELSLENSKLQREVDTFKTKFGQLESTLANEQKLYLENVSMLQDQLHDEQRVADESMKRLKQQLDDERESSRSSHYERVQSIHKFQDEAKEMQEREVLAAKTRLTRENEVQLEKLQEKYKREMDSLTQKIQNGELRISQVENSLKSREDEIERMKSQSLEENQKFHHDEAIWRDEITKHEEYNKALKAEIVSLRQNEENMSATNRALEQSFDDKIHETTKLQNKIQNQVEESNKIHESKKEEIHMLRSLVRQQEDATRLLGEKMRNEAQEQIRSALQREREALDGDREKQKEKLTEIKDSYEDIVKQVRAELHGERTSHHQLQATVLKMRKDMEKLRERNLRTQEEKVNEILQLRTQSKEQILRLKDKIQELAMATDRNEKDVVLEINEECRRVAVLIGGSPNTTPIKSNSLSSSFMGESPGSNTNSPAREALANLKSCNAELRQHLIEARREIEFQKNEPFKRQPLDNIELTQQQIILFKKALRSKEDEISRLKRQIQEETNRSTSQYKSERAMMQKTIDRLEKDLNETKKLIPASSPIVNGHAFSDATSGLGTSFGSNSASPRPGDDSSTTKLLRHLQGRVQQLRAQNDSLRSDSLNESQSSVGTVDSTFECDGPEDTNHTRKLQSALQLSDQRANRNAAMLNQKMMEMTKLQKMLTHATKENMKLERAYASLQKTIIDAPP